MIDQASVDALAELMSWISEHEDPWLESIPFVQIQYRFTHGGYWTISMDGQTACVAAGGWTLLRLLSNRLLKEHAAGAKYELAQKANTLSNILRRNRSAATSLASNQASQLWTIFDSVQRALQALEREPQALAGNPPSFTPDSHFSRGTELVFDMVCLGETGPDGANLYFLKPNLLTLQHPNGFKHANAIRGTVEFLKNAATILTSSDENPAPSREDYFQSVSGIFQRALESVRDSKIRPSV